MNIAVTNGNDLCQDEFTFYFDVGISTRVTLRLNAYYRRTRPTKRHGWKVIQKWSTFDTRTNTMQWEDVPLTDSEIDNAKSQICIMVQNIEVAK